MQINWKEILNIENRTKYFVHVFSFLSLVSIVIFILLFIGSQSLTEPKPAIAQTEKLGPFADIAIEAKAVFVWDVVNQREVFSKNPDTPLPLASLTKVMTALVAKESIPQSSDIEIDLAYLAPEGDSGLTAGDRWRASDLADYTLITSSNDGAFALAAVAEARNSSTREDFLSSMNKRATEIGLTNSSFFNEHGLDIDKDLSGAYGSARDMAILFEYTLKNSPDILQATKYEQFLFSSAFKNYPAQNTNTSVNKIPGILASKTGFTDLAGGNLVIAYDPGLNRPIIISVLGSSEEGRFRDTLKLVEATFKEIQK